MPLLVHLALIACVVTSGVGALIMCVLVLVYGFSAGPDEPADRARRRWLVTRVGHAAAGTCFAITAILSLVVLARPWASPPPVAMPATGEPGLQTRVDTLDSGLGAVEARMTRVEARLGVAEAGLRKPGDGVAAARARLRPAERPATAPRRPAVVTPAPSSVPNADMPPSASGPATPEPTSGDLARRMRGDWHAVRRAFEKAGDDFMRSGR